MSVLDPIRRILDKNAFIKGCRAVLKEQPNSAIANSLWLHAAQHDRWAHAGGGRYHVFGNSQEAFDDALESGFSIIEADVMLTSDGVPVMSHRFRPNNEIEFDAVPTLSEFLSTSVNGRYTPMSLDSFCERYSGADAYFAIDPSPSMRIRMGADWLLTYIKDRTDKRFQERVIYQISGVSSLCRFMQIEWKGAFHYNLGFDLSDYREHWRFDWLIPALKAIGVASVSYVDMPITSALGDAICRFKSSGLIVSVASVNSSERYEKLKKLGVECIDTDYLYPTGRIYPVRVA